MSRLQPGEDVVQSVYKQAKGELRLPIEDYALFWPDQKVYSAFTTCRPLYKSISIQKYWRLAHNSERVSLQVVTMLVCTVTGLGARCFVDLVHLICYKESVYSWNIEVAF